MEHAPAELHINPALTQVRWRYVAYAGALVVLGLVLLLFQPILGLAVLLAGLALGGISLRPLWRTGSFHVIH